MNNIDKKYLKLLDYILTNGSKKPDRTGTGTLSIFDYTIRFNMKEGFPLLTSKKMFTKGVIHELIWFLNGDTNIKYLVDNDVHIWDGDCYKNYLKDLNRDNVSVDDANYILLSKKEFIEKIKTDDYYGEFSNKWGDMGPIYGKQWRYWSHMSEKEKKSQAIGLEGCVNDYIDQIETLIEQLKSDPDSRRMIVSAWNVADLESMVLPPCHYGFQCYTRELSLNERCELGYKYVDPFEWDMLMGNAKEGEDINNCDDYGIPKRALSLKWHQRSVDVFLGLPFNIASYGLLLELLAKECNMVAEDLIFSGGDAHLYLNHVEQAKEQLNRETFNLPKLVLKNESLEKLKFEDIEIIGYKSAGILKGELSN